MGINKPSFWAAKRTGKNNATLENQLTSFNKRMNLRQHMMKMEADHQEERTNLPDKVQWAEDEERNLEYQLETCLKETDTLRQQKEKQMSDHQEGAKHAADAESAESERKNLEYQLETCLRHTLHANRSTNVRPPGRTSKACWRGGEGTAQGNHREKPHQGRGTKNLERMDARKETTGATTIYVM
jgi:hypothetical protein